jgi:hypothetical protein
MYGGGRASGDLEGLGARLIIAAALDELRLDPEAFARLLLALARVKEADAVEIASLLSRGGLAVPDYSGRSCECLPNVTLPEARPVRGMAPGLTE